MLVVVKLINLGKVIKCLLLKVVVLHVLTHYILSRYFSAASIDLNSSAYIFRTLQPRRKEGSYTLGPGRLSYTRCRELVKDSLLSI